MQPLKIDRPLVIGVADRAVGKPNLAVDENGTVFVAVEAVEENKRQKAKEKDEMENVLTYVLSNKLNVLFRESEEAILEFSKKAANASIEKALEVRSAIFSKGKWHGDDIGSQTEPLNNLYSKGEMIGLRLENKKELPESSGKNVGRVVFETDEEAIYIDCGYKFKRLSINKFELDVQVSDPKLPIEVDLRDIDLDSAPDTIFQVMDASNDCERINAKIKTPGLHKLVVELPEGSPVSTYRILGIE